MACVFKYGLREYTDCLIFNGYTETYDGVTVESREERTTVRFGEELERIDILRNGYWECDYFLESVELDAAISMVKFISERNQLLSVRHMTEEALRDLMQHPDDFTVLPVTRRYVATKKTDEE